MAILKDIADCDRRIAKLKVINTEFRGRYKVGDLVRVLFKSSAYYLLIGKVVEVTRFNDSGIIEFSNTMLQSARQPEQVLRAKRQVHFYWRELQKVVEG